MNVVKNPQYKTDKRRGRPERRKRPLRRVVIDREILAWAAGFVDGEGSFLKVRRTDASHKSGHTMILSVGQVDRRVLDKLRRALCLGKVYGPYGPYGEGKEKEHQPHYQCDIYGFEQVQAALALLWTWLGPVKREQAITALYAGE